MKKDKFGIEINYIKNERLKENLIKLVEKIPNYFFEVPASSTGKYHPSYSQGKGGLLRHTKALVRFAKELLDNPLIGDKYTNDEKDLMIIAGILHDTAKLGINGEAKYTLFEHPLLVGDYIRKIKEELTLTEDEINFLDHVISSHMGVWNTSDYSDIVLPRPSDKYQNFVHMCDYLASRKVFILEFDENDNIIN